MRYTYNFTRVEPSPQYDVYKMQNRRLAQLITLAVKPLSEPLRNAYHFKLSKLFGDVYDGLPRVNQTVFDKYVAGTVAKAC